MKIIYSVIMIYALAFAIGMFVALIIWILNRAMSGNFLHKLTHREEYQEMKRLKLKRPKQQDN